VNPLDDAPGAFAQDRPDVTEGSGGIRERLRYDWSDPRRIVMVTTDSSVAAVARGFRRCRADVSSPPPR